MKTLYKTILVAFATNAGRWLVIFLMVGWLNISHAQLQWQQTQGPTGGNINSLAVSGSNLFAGANGGVFRSTNNGGSWTAVNTGLTNTAFYALAASGSNLFAGNGNGLFLSTNDGDSWTQQAGLSYKTLH